VWHGIQHVTAFKIADHHDSPAILHGFVRYTHPKTTATSECQQLVIYRDIFSWTVVLFAVVDENFTKICSRQNWSSDNRASRLGKPPITISASKMFFY